MEWKISQGLVEYPEALAVMAARVEAIQRGEAEELVWLVEHPPLYTLGTSAKVADVLGGGIPTYATGRGGQVTYHGPGQRVAYVLRDLNRHAGAAGPDLRAYVKDLERWMIATLAQFGIEAFTREGRVGVWVQEGDWGLGIRDLGSKGWDEATVLLSNPQSPIPNPEKKIAALGVRVQKWVTSHGVALNVCPNLAHYAGIVPCGIREFGVTSMHALGATATMAAVDAVLKQEFVRVFGRDEFTSP